MQAQISQGLDESASLRYYSGCRACQSCFVLLLFNVYVSRVIIEIWSDRVDLI